MLLQEAGQDALTLLPARVPQRATLALVLGTLLNAPAARAAVLALLDTQIQTATDLLRMLEVVGSGDGRLAEAWRTPRLSRPLRRALLARLDALDPRNLTEDLHRHPAAWKRAGEVLHPFEFAARHPNVAVAFAALRGTTPGRDALGEELRAARLPGLRQVRGRVRFSGWAGLLERALAAGDVDGATRLLAQRPGELGRRLDVLLRVTLSARPEALPRVTAEVLGHLPQLTGPMLLLLRSHLAARHQPWPVRLVFPQASAQSYALPDRRPGLPQPVTRPIRGAITAELLTRAGRLPRFPVGVLDLRLRGLPVPFAERQTARALVTLARGTRLELPRGRFARLFVHWMEHPSQRVDLDLSVAFYDAQWQSAGHCDFGQLRFLGSGAVHSGDLTSAPAPLGASEFVDLDLQALRAGRMRYAVMSVLSYNGVPFEGMAEAFAGYMLRERADGPAFDARAVEQRYDLRGAQKVSVPLALDLEALTLHWLDTAPKSRGLGETAGHQVAVYRDTLGLSARRVIESAGLAARPTLWDLAALHTAARCDAVVVWHLDAGEHLLERGERTEAAFLERLNALSITDLTPSPVFSPQAPVLGAFLHRDRPLPPGSEVFALRDGMLEEGDVRRRGFSEALTDLEPPAD